MKKTTMNRLGASIARLAAVGMLAAALAVSPLTAFASAAGTAQDDQSAHEQVDSTDSPVSAADASETVVPGVASMPLSLPADAPAFAEGSAGASDATQNAATTSVTVSYYEGAGYEDEEQTTPIVILRETRTFDGVEVGSEIDPWDYVVNFPDLLFFDGWADNVIADADPAKNQVTLKYLRMRWPLTIHYYAISNNEAVAAAAEDLAQDAVPAAAFSYEYLGEYQTPSQPLGQVIDSELLAVPLDGMVHLGANREEVQIGNVPADNQVNVFYYELPSGDVPDAGEGDDGAATPAPVPPTDAGTSSGPNSGDDSGLGSDGGASDAEVEEADGNGSDSASSSQETVIVEDGTPLADAAENGILPLPQTGDDLGISLVVAAGFMVTAAAVMAVLRRRAR